MVLGSTFKEWSVWPCLFCIHRAKNKRFFCFFFEFFLTMKSFLNPHFNGFGAISRLRGCRSCFSVHFGPGDVPKAPTGTRFKPILMFFAIFFGPRVPFFGHSLLSNSQNTHLSTSLLIPLQDCHQSLYHHHQILSTFFQHLRFIWLSHRFQFLGCALPIGF